jgi:hypothetical protein
MPYVIACVMSTSRKRSPRRRRRSQVSEARRPPRRHQKTRKRRWSRANTPHQAMPSMMRSEKFLVMNVSMTVCHLKNERANQSIGGSTRDREGEAVDTRNARALNRDRLRSAVIDPVADVTTIAMGPAIMERVAAVRAVKVAVAIDRAVIARSEEAGAKVVGVESSADDACPVMRIPRTRRQSSSAVESRPYQARRGQTAVVPARLAPIEMTDRAKMDPQSCRPSRKVRSSRRDMPNRVSRNSPRSCWGSSCNQTLPRRTSQCQCKCSHRI